MIRSNVCDYCDAYIHVKAIITVPKTTAQGADVNNTNKKVIFKKCAPFNNCMSKITHTQVDDAWDIDIVITIYNLIEYSDQEI